VGILIENILQGIHIGYTIAGVGVNINQTEWRSNAPNPISMKEITGKEYDIDGLLNEWICTMKSWENRKTEELSSAYLQRLYRREGWHEYVEREVSIIPTAIAEKGTKDTFLAEIVTVTTQGELILRLQNREEKKYNFKQIRFVV
jgi:BirA family biotin operon repressor/biotin-[acetyl-CoA-carboxylase] ligase